MAELWNKTQNKKLISHLIVADKFIDRGVGLLKFKKLDEHEGMWIKRCNSIHTFFMKFSIDCVFVDKELRVISLVTDIHPWRLILPQFGSDSVIELNQGAIKKLNLFKGDQLYVVS